MRDLFERSGRRWTRWLAGVLLMVGGSAVGVQAADPEFLGALALLADDGVVRRLELTPEQKDQIGRLIEQREAMALELAVSARQLPPAEKAARQAEFVAESEREGLQILTNEQRERWEKLRLSREGLAALARPGLADTLGLTDEQRQAVDELLKARAEALAKADDGPGPEIVTGVYNKKLEKLLTDEQRAQWESMTEVSGPEATASAGTSSAPPGEPATAAADQGLPADADGRLRFNFRYAPWRDVLDWFATQADLSLVLDAPPPGTFNYTDNRSYSAEEAIDVLNSVLLTKGYTLVRRERMLLLINLEDGIPPNLVTTVPLQDLDRRGEFELVSTLFRLVSVAPEDAEQEITKLLGPQGSMQVLPKAKQIFVTETAGRLRTIRDVLRAMEDPDGIQAGRVTTFQLQHVLPEDVFEVVRQMLGLPEGQNAAADGSIRMATDVTGQRIMVSGQPELVQQVGQLIKLVDVPMPVFGRGGSVTEAPQLEVHPVYGADPESALLVLQTLLADEDVRLATDPKTGSVVALGTPGHHATIRATLEQMRAGGQTIDVVPLHVLDPQVALLAINRLFGVGEEGNTSAPKVEVDLTTRQLMIRATQGQIDQIHALLQKLGETPEAALALNDQSTRSVRVLPIGGNEAQALLQQIQQIWPTMRENRIRTVTPSTVIRSIAPRAEGDRPTTGLRAIDRRRPLRRAPDDIQPTPGGGSRTPPPAAGREERRAEDATEEIPSTRVGQAAETTRAATIAADAAGAATDQLLAQASDATPELDDAEPSASRPLIDDPFDGSSRDDGADNSTPRSPSDQSTADSAPATEDAVEPGADIVIAVSPSGLIIASKDLEALNDFEELMRQLSSSESTGGRDFAVFYLKHATAESATQIVNNILSGATVTGSDDGGGLIGAALDGLGGGLMGSLLGIGGASTFQASGSYSIVPEPRLNMLVVQANPADLQLIEQLLEIIDQRASPELVQTVPAPRMIPVYYTSADKVAEVVRQVFASHLAAGPGQQRQPTPEDFIRALRGGGGGRGGRGGDRDNGADQQRQLTIGVDTRGNQLVVGAPDDLFFQIEALVRELDTEDSESHETTRVVTLDRVNPELVRRALTTIVGQPQQAQSPQSSATAQGPGGQRRGGGDRGQGEGRGGDRGGDMRQQVEVFRALQQQMGGDRGGGGGNRGAGGGGGRGGGNRGGNFRGGGGGGFRGR